MRNIYIILLFLIPVAIQAQLQTAHWYFGYNAGLDFTSGSPVAITNGQIETLEGSAVMSDNNGNLIFYTDGITVYNKNHVVMSNGTGLMSNPSSTQAAIVIPKPEHPDIYYIFTIWNANGLRYSVVDMSLDGGNGAIIEKNTFLMSLTGMGGSEKLTAATIAGCSGYWVVTHFIGSFHAFPVTSSGVGSAVVSTVGLQSYYPIQGAGHIKLSPNGKKLAVAHRDFYNDIGALGLYDFDNVTGVVSNEQLLYAPSQTNKRKYYGVEFSPDNNVLYATCEIISEAKNFLEQYDLTSNSIASSRYIVDNWSGVVSGALQLGLDNRIYHTRWNEYLAVVNNPNQLTSSGYNLQGVSLGGRNSTHGLPPFITSLFYAGIMINGINNLGAYCEQELNFSYCHNGGEVSAIFWEFGDGITSSLENPTHTYAPGTYTLSLHLTIGQNTYTTQEEITIHPLPDVQNAELDKCALENEEVTFDLTESYFQINPNGEENLTYTFHLTEADAENNVSSQPLNYPTTSSATLWVRVENEWGCVTIVELELITNLTPTFTIENPAIEICTGSSVELEIMTDEANIVNWYSTQTGTTPIFTGDPFTTPNLTVTTSYWVEVVSEEGCSSDRQEIVITVTDEITPLFTQIEPVCFGEEFELPSESINGITGTWSPEIDNTQTTTYTFEPDAEQCSGQFEMTVEVVPIPEITLPDPIEICSGETVSIAVSTTGETLNWYANETDTTPIHTGLTFSEELTETTTYWLEAVTGNCKSERISLTVTVKEIPNLIIEFPEVEICINSWTELEITTATTNTVNWYDSATSTTIIFTGNPFTTPNLTATTSYWVEAVSDENCISERQEIIVTVADEITPLFTQIEAVCLGEEFDLPVESLNGITGTWTPAIDNNQTTTYTFEPDAGQCSAENVTMIVEVVPIPEIELPDPIALCSGETVSITIITTGETLNWYENELDTTPIFTGLNFSDELTETTTFWLEAQTGNCKSERIPFTITVNPLPTIEVEISNPVCEGNPAELSVITNGLIVNWYTSETATTPIFTGNPFTTPNLTETTIHWVESVSSENCTSERIPFTATVLDEITPIFNFPTQYCLNSEEIILPTESDNNVSGTWFPAIINTYNLGTVIYEFTPDLECGEIIEIPVTIVEIILPEFDELLQNYCLGANAETLPNISNNGINGTWFPSQIDTNIQGATIYTFTPNEGQCSEPYQHTVTVYPHPDMDLDEELLICEGDSFTYSAPNGFDSYLWKNESNQIISSTQEVTFTEEGIYTLKVEINGVPCDLSRNIEVRFSTPPTITEVKTTENTITIYATGGNPLEYSMNQVFWQSSPTFTNLQPGIFNVYVRDAKGCSTTAKQTGILGVPNFISPNGDGYNDTWELRGLEVYPNMRLQIFDRYGKIFVDRMIDSSFTWDGKYNNQPLPSGSYWYILILEDGERVSGNINIRNY